MTSMQIRQRNPLEDVLELSEQHRAWAYTVTAVLALFIAWLDWRIVTASLGFLYVVPIVLASGILSRWHILMFATICGVLRELFSPIHPTPGATARICIGTAGFALVGFFVSELNRKRQLVTQHLREREQEMQRRYEAEQQLRVVIETSPLAILTVNNAGKVLVANDSAQQLLGLDGEPAEGLDIQLHLPILNRFLQRSTTNLRTTVETKGQRKGGEVFLAHIWLSTFCTSSGPHLAAFIWDASEDLRDREGTGLDSMMATSRILIGAVSHEIRNLAAAAVAAHAGLSSLPGIDGVEHYQALGAIIKGLQKIAASGLRLASQRSAAVADLGMVLDETRVVVEPAIRECGARIEWKIDGGLPLVQGDHHNLLQVFLNLARNCQQAIAEAADKVLTVEAGVENDWVQVRFRDTGCGVSNPDELFTPFQPGARSTGLGLYISRAVLRSHGGDLRYEPCPKGSCFVVQLWPAEDPQERAPV